MAQQKNQLASNIVSLYVLQGLNYVIPLIVLPYLVRHLGMEEYGLVAFSQAFAQYFVIFTDYGFNFSATRSIAQNREDVRAIRSTVLEVFLIKTVILVAGLILLAIMALALPQMRHDVPYFLLAFIGVLGNVLFPQWYFQGIERMQYISVYTGIAKVVSTAFLFLLVHGPNDGLWAVAILSSGPLIAGIMGVWTALREIGFQFERPARQSLHATLADGWHVFVGTASVCLYTNTNVFMVGLLAGNTQAGYFSAAEKLIRGMAGTLGPITQALYPRISALAASSRDAALSLVSKSLLWVSGASIVFSIGIFFLAKFITTLLFGASGAGSYPVIRSIAALPFLIAVNNVLGIQTMLTFGLDRQFSWILLLSGLFNVAAGIVLIHSLGAQGAGISVFLTEAIISVAMLVVLWRNGIHFFRRTMQFEG